jgi:hypothetical protein
MIAPEVLDALVAAGATAEMIAAAVKADHAIDEQRSAAKRARNAERMRDVRERARTNAHNDARARTAEHADQKESSPTPPKEKTTSYEGSNEPSPEGADAPQAEFFENDRARLFGEGKTTLIALGVSEKQAGKLIGYWLKNVGDNERAVLGAIQRARDARPVDPIAWITAALKADSHGTSSQNRNANRPGKTASDALVAGMAATLAERPDSRLYAPASGTAGPIPGAAHDD